MFCHHHREALNLNNKQTFLFSHVITELCPDIQHTDGHPVIPWGYTELSSKDRELGLITICVGRRFKDRVAPSHLIAAGTGLIYGRGRHQECTSKEYEDQAEPASPRA